MKRSTGILHVVVPGLFGPIPLTSRLPPFPGHSLLENAFGRADIHLCGGRELESILFHCFELTSIKPGELPFGALRRLGDGLDDDGGIWFQADPVALRPDQDRLLIFDMVDFELAETEARMLISAFNSHFEEDGLRLEMGTPCRWYLKVESMPEILTRPLGEAFGRNMDMFLPQGADGLRWHGLLNEVQMLFHSQDVNGEREAGGRIPVGGIWISGGGVLPSVEPVFDLVVSNEPLAVGLGRAAGAATCPLDGWEAAGESGSKEILLVDHRPLRAVWCADPDRWIEQLEAFTGRFEVYVEILRSGGLGEIRLYPADGQVYSITDGSFRRFWRRRQSLAERLVTG